MGTGYRADAKCFDLHDLRLGLGAGESAAHVSVVSAESGDLRQSTHGKTRA